MKSNGLQYSINNLNVKIKYKIYKDRLKRYFIFFKVVESNIPHNIYIEDFWFVNELMFKLSYCYENNEDDMCFDNRSSLKEYIKQLTHAQYNKELIIDSDRNTTAYSLKDNCWIMLIY